MSNPREELLEIAGRIADMALGALLEAELLEIDPEVDLELLRGQLMERVLTTKSPDALPWNLIKTLEKSVFVEEIFGDNDSLLAIVTNAIQ
jgi:hypothetical protein